MLIPKPPCSFFCVETVVWPRNTAEGPELQESVMLQPCCMVLWLFFCFCMFQSSLCCWEWKVREETPWGYARPPKFVFFVVWVRVGMDSVFPFVMWTNSIFWAWFGCTQSFLLWCRPIQSFGHGWDEFSASFCDVVTTWSWWIFEAIIKVRRVWSPFWSPIQSVGMWNGSVLSFSM